MSAVARSVLDRSLGAQIRGGVADSSDVIDGRAGPPQRHIDYATADLDRLARSWIDLQQTRKALAQRELPAEIVGEFDRLERKVSAMLSRALRRHPLWPWLSQFPGLGGAHTALVIGRIGDPRRFPGQRCSEGHYLPPLYAVGAPCPVAGRTSESDVLDGDGDLAAGNGHESDSPPGRNGAGADEISSESVTFIVCPGTMLAPRETTGVRSLWHWAGLHVEPDGRAPRKRKGTKATWEPRVRASVMQPGGIAEQIVRLSVPHYVDVYREAKAQLSLRGDLRPFEADRIARKIAAKRFLGDLLIEWKRVSG